MFLRFIQFAFFLFLAVICGGCNHSTTSANLHTCDSLISGYERLTLQIDSLADSERFDKLKTEAGGRLILVDKYLQKADTSDSFRFLFEYAANHASMAPFLKEKQALKLEIKKSQQRLHLLKSDIGQQKWSKDSTSVFLRRETELFSYLSAGWVSLKHKEQSILQTHQQHHAAVVWFTDSLLKKSLERVE